MPSPSIELAEMNSPRPRRSCSEAAFVKNRQYGARRTRLPRWPVDDASAGTFLVVNSGEHGAARRTMGPNQELADLQIHQDQAWAALELVERARGLATRTGGDGPVVGGARTHPRAAPCSSATRCSNEESPSGRSQPGSARHSSST